MATTAGPTQRPTSVREASGWAVFAGVILLISGFFAVMWGLAAILNDQVVTVGGRGVTIWDFTAWGWINLVIGSVMMLTAFGLFSMRGWARWTAVFFASLNAMVQVGGFSAFPLWSLLVIALDVIVIYQLTANWDTSGY